MEYPLIYLIGFEVTILNTGAKMFFKAWLFFFVTTLLLWVLLGVPIAVVLAISLGLFDIAKENARIVAQILAWVFCISFSFVSYRWSVKTYIFPKLRDPFRE